MREILFRGKRTDNGEWVEGNLFIPDSDSRPTQILMGTDIVRISYEIDPETVGQYTGLTNKDGKKLFEGDIIQYRNTNGNIINPLEVIIFKENGWRAKPTKSDITYELTTNSAKHYNIVGNIYDNVELIRKELYE